MICVVMGDLWFLSGYMCGFELTEYIFLFMCEKRYYLVT